MTNDKIITSWDVYWDGEGEIESLEFTGFCTEDLDSIANFIYSDDTLIGVRYATTLDMLKDSNYSALFGQVWDAILAERGKGIDKTYYQFRIDSERKGERYVEEILTIVISMARNYGLDIIYKGDLLYIETGSLTEIVLDKIRVLGWDEVIIDTGEAVSSI